MCITFYNVFKKLDKRFLVMVRRRESVDIGKHLYNVSINGLCTWFNNVFRKRFNNGLVHSHIYHCVSASYAITMLWPPPCQSLSKIQCKYCIGPNFREFKFSRIAHSRFFREFLFSRMVTSLKKIPRIHQLIKTLGAILFAPMIVCSV